MKSSTVILAALGMVKIAETIASTKNHSIVAGDTLGGVARRYGVALQRLKDANKGLDPARLQIGQQINIPESDRDFIKRTKGFDPDEVVFNDPMLQYQQMYHESVLGKYKRPINAPVGNTAYGYLQMTRPAWDEAVKNQPDWFKGRKFEELATDPRLALTAQRAYLEPRLRRWQYRNGKPATWETAVRMWYMPGDPYGKAATDYFNRVKSVKWHDIVRQGLQSSPEMQQLMFGEKAEEYRKRLGNV